MKKLKTMATDMMSFDERCNEYLGNWGQLGLVNIKVRNMRFANNAVYQKPQIC